MAHKQRCDLRARLSASLSRPRPHPQLSAARRPLRAKGVYSSFSCNRFLIRELRLGKLSETVVVHGNAPHDRPRDKLVALADEVIE